MLCLPVFITLLLLISSAPSVDAQTKTKNFLTLASLRDFAKKSPKRLTQFECCSEVFSCCR
uniref:Conotoxin n=1 Tax=Conus emaciatus TaxID=89442 RepID=S4UKA7_CONEM|nr:T superfamily conotoxin Ec5.1 precursor [Conus emaciatus]